MNTLYFSRLYPNPVDHPKIDLTSIQFYLDAADLYCRNERERKILISGFKFLAFQIKDPDEIDNIVEIFEAGWIRLMFKLASLIKFSSKEVVGEFHSAVADILNTRKIEIDDRNRREITRLRAENKEGKINIASLIKTQSLLPIPQVDLEQIETTKVKEPKPKAKKSSIVLNNATDGQIALIIDGAMFKHRDEIKRVFEYLNDGYLCKLDGKDFTAVALILYKTGYFARMSTFAGFKKFLAECYNRETPSYKQSQVKETADKIKEKIHCLYKLPTN